jgi:hypothetical protein
VCVMPSYSRLYFILPMQFVSDFYESHSSFELVIFQHCLFPSDTLSSCLLSSFILCESVLLNVPLVPEANKKEQEFLRILVRSH